MATRFLQALSDQYHTLCQFPESGPVRDYLYPGIRVQFYRGYASYYRVESQRVVIIRVLNGARDVETLAAQGAFEG